jgi:crotonobetainyl-CoA:carnitine CoA-transferase CaiB-like acyl-CoA transferase
MAEELWRRILTEIWPGAGPPPIGLLEVTGEPGHLPGPLPVEDMAIACAGTALLAAATLHAQRGGKPVTQARLDRAQLAMAFRSERYLTVSGRPLADSFAPLSRFWPAEDGWLRTHANYPWHREALLKTLGTENDEHAVATAIARRKARDLEDEIVAAGGIAAKVRTKQEWLAEPQSQPNAPLITTQTLAGAPPRLRAPAVLPAAGIRVLDLTRVIAGPVCTRYLAALGADVLRIDSPHRPELPLHTVDGLPGKRSALLDLAGLDQYGRDGLATLHELLDNADVLVHGYRPHALDRFGLTPGDIAERHPGLVTVSLSAWGEVGPWGGRRGFDSIVQAASGIAVAEGSASAPGALPCQLLDHGTGYLCAAAALGSLAAQQAGGGTHVRTLSLARTSRWLLAQPHSAAAAPATATADAPWRCTLDSADGPVTTIAPPGELDGHGLSWPRPLSRYGTDAPAWA